jgi:GNAT superfamily N-acetyltransferase
MTETLRIQIRNFEEKDRKQVRAIAHDTAFMGRPASVFFEGPELVSDALTLYFTDFEPRSSFVACAQEEVAGYLTGAKNKASSEKVFMRKIAGRLFLRIIAGGALLRMKNLVFIFKCLQEMVKGSFLTPDFNRQYPATLHINIKEPFRGKGIGSGLLDSYLAYLKKEGVCGVHLATMSDRGADFFCRYGFKMLYKGRRSYFKHILNQDVPLYVFGMKIDVE